MRNLKMTIQYDGGRYKGFQKQKGNIPTIQAKVEDVLSKMTGEEVQLIGCGRTDTGVHAEAYVANFRTDTEMTVNQIMDYLYEYLPEDIVVKSVKDTSDRFHARYNVKGKTYVYKINNAPTRDVFSRRYAYHIEQELDIAKMKEASKYLIGTHDFNGYTNLKAKNDKSTVRTINFINIERNGNMVTIEVNGNGFLLNMVRIIVGTLVEVGLSKVGPEKVKTVLESKKREECGPIAQAKGLTLKEVQY